MTDVARHCASCEGLVPVGAITCPSCGAIAPPPAARAPEFASLSARLTASVGTRYTIDRALGRGGMATVFLGHDERHHRAVAIKVLLPELASALGPERFLREIEIAAQLSHPHIVPLYDSGEAEGLLYYVMPYVEGASLRHRIAQEGPLPIADVVRIAREVADALAYAHGLGVIHRDIKPENILLTHHHAAVADFGVARALHATWATTPTTTGGMALGTPHYMSPEQAESSPTIDRRTDIYALGCVVYEMLTGRPPYSGPGTVAILAQHLSEPVPLPSALRADAPPEFDRIVARAMAKSPDDRYADAADLSADLAPLAGTTSGANAFRPAPLRPRRMGWLAAATVLIVLALAGVAQYLRRPGASPAASSHPALRVVVRAFDDVSPDLRETANRLTKSLTDQLLAPALHVTPSAAVAALHDASIDSLTAKFSPDRIVVGSVEHAAAGRLRIVLRIIDPATVRGLSADTVVVDATAATEPATVEALSMLVRRTLWSEIDMRQRRSRVRDSTAWGLLVQAGELAEKAQEAATYRLDQTGLRSLEVADSLLAVARDRDRESDLIVIEQALLRERRAFIVDWFNQVLPAPPAGLPRADAERLGALATLDTLIATNGGTADALELRGVVKFGLYRNLQQDSLLDAAIADQRAATERDLHRASAWEKLSQVQREGGKFTESLFSIQRAFEEDVFSLVHTNLLRAQFDAALRASRFDVAAHACAAWMKEAPPPQLIYDCQLELWSRTASDPPTALRARARADSLRDAGDSLSLTDVRRQLHVADIMARAGLGESADDIVKRLPRRIPRGWRPMIPLELAYYQLLRGRTDSAAVLVVGAIEADPTTRRLILTVPWFAPLRSDPRVRGSLAPNPR